MARRVVDGLVVVRSSFFSGNKLVRAGDVWDADDPVVRNYRSNFRPLEALRSETPKPEPVKAKAPATRRPAK